MVDIIKAKDDLELVLDQLPVDVYKACLKLGARQLMNSGMSKITKKECGDDLEVMKAKAMAKARDNLEAMYNGTIKLPNSAKTKKIKVPAEVLTEARRMAKAMVKDELKRNGIKLKYVAAKDITYAANQYLESEAGRELIPQAQEAIDARKSKKARPSVANIHLDQKLVQADKDKAAQAKEQATEAESQAGRVMAQMRQQPPMRDRRS
jgi:hypothetical protein